MSTIGCGRFTETQWIEYLFTPDDTGDVGRHHAKCPQCQSEVNQLLDTANLVRHVASSEAVATDAFVDAVLADPALRQPRLRLEHSHMPKPRRLPIVQGAVALAAAACIAIVVWMSGDPISLRSTPPGTPIRSTSASIVVDTDAAPLTNITVANGVTTALDPSPSSTSAPPAQPLRSSTGSTYAVASSSW